MVSKNGLRGQNRQVKLFIAEETCKFCFNYNIQRLILIMRNRQSQTKMKGVQPNTSHIQYYLIYRRYLRIDAQIKSHTKHTRLWIFGELRCNNSWICGYFIVEVTIKTEKFILRISLAYWLYNTINYNYSR